MAMQLVLDTNVWIDWLVFDDPSVTPLKAAHRNGQIQIMINEDCLGELKAVLAYPEFGLDEMQKMDHLAEIERCTTAHEERRPSRAIALPRCRDPDDQKFLLLAQSVEADWLLTRDKALLRLNRRAKVAGFRVGSPADWSAASTQPV